MAKPNTLILLVAVHHGDDNAYHYSYPFMIRETCLDPTITRRHRRNSAGVVYEFIQYLVCNL